MQVNCDISSNIHANNIRSQFSGYRGIPSNALVSQLLLVLLNVPDLIDSDEPTDRNQGIVTVFSVFYDLQQQQQQQIKKFL